MGCQVPTTLSNPGIVVIGMRVAAAVIAQQRDDAPPRTGGLISATSCKAPQMFVPVEPPTQRSSLWVHHRMAAIDAASGTEIIRSTSSGTKLGSTRGRPIPSILEPTAVTPRSRFFHPV